MSVNDLHLASDAFRHGALGKTGYRLLEALTELGSATASELVSAVPGIHPSTVRRRLQQFLRLGIAAFDSGRWRALPADLDAVARRLGTAGKAGQQRATHEAQRQAYLRQPWMLRSRRP